MTGLGAADSALQARCDVAEDIARKVGEFALGAWSDVAGDEDGVELKGLQDFVTAADKQAEAMIRAEMKARFPDDGFMGEETGGVLAGARCWVVDPIDGTSNFIKGLKHWGVSIAYVENGAVEIGVVVDAPHGRTYSAMRGRGAFCDGRRIAASRCDDPERAMAIMGVSRRTSFDEHLDTLRDLFDAGIQYRLLGSAAIGLARVAEGVADAYYERHLNIWDALAGALIAHEAGASVRMPPLGEFAARGGPVLACAPGLFDQLSSLPGVGNCVPLDA